MIKSIANLEKRIRELQYTETNLNLKIECCKKSELEGTQLALLDVQDRIFLLKEKRDKIKNKYFK